VTNKIDKNEIVKMVIFVLFVIALSIDAIVYLDFFKIMQIFSEGTTYWRFLFCWGWAFVFVLSLIILLTAIFGKIYEKHIKIIVIICAAFVFLFAVPWFLLMFAVMTFKP
jgi:hypothetical protein